MKQILFFDNFLIFLKTFQDLSAKYYQNNEKRLLKDIKVFVKKKNKESNKMVAKGTKIYQKMQSKSWLSIKKTSNNEKKMCYYNYKKPFLFRKFISFLMTSIINVFLSQFCFKSYLNIQNLHSTRVRRSFSCHA